MFAILQYLLVLRNNFNQVTYTACSCQSYLQYVHQFTLFRVLSHMVFWGFHSIRMNLTTHFRNFENNQTQQEIWKQQIFEMTTEWWKPKDVITWQLSHENKNMPQQQKKLNLKTHCILGENLLNCGLNMFASMLMDGNNKTAFQSLSVRSCYEVQPNVVENVFKQGCKVTIHWSLF